MNILQHPCLYQVNTRVLLTGLSAKMGRKATLRDVPDDEIDRWADLGFHWVWLLSVWQTGSRGREISRKNPEWLKEFEETLPDLKADDIQGSGFAITAYNVHAEMGGDDALADLRKRLRARNLNLILDFVPNHVAIDHPWINEHPYFLITGNESLLADQPQNYFKTMTANGERVFAYGRDPYFSGWPDTVQLNYSNPSLQEEMISVLQKISGQCDGVRCDMAMLVLPEVFEKTWGRPAPSFWPGAIRRVKEDHPDFVFMAEVYWDMEWTLQQHGFNYTYDKRLYDRLKERNAYSVWEHLCADKEFQTKSARFLENHDEPRAASAFPQDIHEAAAIITFLSPGLRFFHQGQLKGMTKRISPHLVRGPRESKNAYLETFYKKLLKILKQPAFHSGEWKLLRARATGDGNSSYRNFIGFAWTGENAEKFLIVVNYSSEKSQAFLEISFSDLRGGMWSLKDQFSDTIYDRHGNELSSQGLFLDEPGWKYYVFRLEST